MKSGWGVLRSDPEMLVFPAISGIACLILLATFAVPFFLSNSWGLANSNRETEQKVLFFGCWFVSYVALNFVMFFFNSAMVACALIRLQGGDPTLGDGWRAAFSRLPANFGWAVLAATVGLVLKMIEARFKKIGEIVAGLLGCAWTLASFLAIPILIVENKGPFAALKESTRLLRNTWGEQLIGNLSFGILFFLLNIPGLLMIAAGVALGVQHDSWKIALSGAASGAAWFVILALVQSAVQCIFQTAVYLYARDGVAPQGFDAEAMSGTVGVQAAA